MMAQMPFGLTVKYNFIFFFHLNLFSIIVVELCKDTIFNKGQFEYFNNTKKKII